LVKNEIARCGGWSVCTVEGDIQKIKKMKILICFILVSIQSIGQNVKVIQFDVINNSSIEKIFVDNSLTRINYLNGFESFRYDKNNKLIKHIQYNFSKFEDNGIESDSAVYLFDENGRYLDMIFSENYVRVWLCDEKYYKFDNYNLIESELCLLNSMGIILPNTGKTEKIVLRNLDFSIANSRYMTDCVIFGTVNKIEIYLSRGLLTKFVLFSKDKKTRVIEMSFLYDKKNRLVSKSKIDKKIKKVISSFKYFYE
jgi:hypothetical protein